MNYYFLHQKTTTYQETAELFLVGEASVSRWLRQYRETGDVKPKPHGGGHDYSVDLAWLREHVEKEPDLRLIDRIESYSEERGKRVSIKAMFNAIHAINYTFKKKPFTRENAIAQRSRNNAYVSAKTKKN